MRHNFTNFNTGSQLIAHFSQLFAAGFKLPLLGGLAVYCWVVWQELSTRLSNNQLHLVVMKVYAEVWRFMEFDSAKAVTLESAFGGTFQLAMVRVLDRP